MSIQAYLINGGLIYGEEPKIKRTTREVESILNNPEIFTRIDVLQDELSFHGLLIEDFEWSKGMSEPSEIGDDSDDWSSDNFIVPD